MCHEPGSVPPNLGEGATAFEQQDLVMRSADGTEFSAYVATPEQPTGKAVVVLPDIRGLHAYYRELAAAFARSGIRAVAIDYFGRTAGLSADRGDDFDWMPHVRALTPEGVSADVAAAVELLKHPASRPVRNGARPAHARKSRSGSRRVHGRILSWRRALLAASGGQR